jgi:hypothetical protein
MSEGRPERLRERRVLARLVGRFVGTSRGVFELADGRQVEVEGELEFDAPEAPEPGQKALIVLDESGQPLRWEPNHPASLGRRTD